MPAAVLAALPEQIVDPYAADPVLTKLLDEVDQDVSHTVDAMIANDLIVTVGNLAKLPSQQELQALGYDIVDVRADRRSRGPEAAQPFQRRTGSNSVPDQSPPDLHILADQSFGVSQGLAVHLHQQLASSSNFMTNLDFHHADGLLDTQVTISGNQPLNGSQIMHLTYNGATFLALASDLQLGMVAKGGLGTLDDFRTSSNQLAGPLVRIKLLGSNTSLNAETGYSFRLQSDSLAPFDRFHLNFNLSVKL